MEGIIIKQISDSYTILSDNTKYTVKPRGNFRHKNITPLVGDHVSFNLERIEKIHPRKNYLVRPSVANIDQALIVISLKEPDLDLVLLDKLLVTVTAYDIEPIICFTKLDLVKEDDEVYNIINYYKQYYQVCNNQDIQELKKLLTNKITVLTGQSGVGKSTLLNKISPNLNIKTDNISKALGRGKHTTRHTEIMLVEDMLVVDTPGFSSLDIENIPQEVIRDTYPEFNILRNNCKFRDCMHNNPVNCAVIKEVGNKISKSRYNNYLKFIRR